MEAFADLDLQEIAARYKKNNALLVTHLRKAGLLPTTAPACHGPMQPGGDRPWVWRCSLWTCLKEKSMLQKGTFLGGCKKPYNAFVALYLWATEHCPGEVKKESKVSYPTLRYLFSPRMRLLKMQGVRERCRCSLGYGY